MIVATAFFYSILLLVSIWWIARQGQPEVFGAGWEEGWAPAVGLGLAVGGVVVAAGSLLRERLRLARDLEAAFRETLGRRGIAEIAVLALFSGTAEEIFFRGALQHTLGWVAASLLFGAVHFVPRRDYLLWTPFAVLMGFLLGGLYLWSENIWAPVTAHVTINSLNLWTICGPAAGAVSPSSPDSSPPATHLPPSPWPFSPPTDSEAPEPPQ